MVTRGRGRACAEAGLDQGSSLEAFLWARAPAHRRYRREHVTDIRSAGCTFVALRKLTTVGEANPIQGATNAQMARWGRAGCPDRVRRTLGRRRISCSGDSSSNGYSEKVVKRARHSHCPLGVATFAFISKRLKDETTGYVCTGYFGTASINDGPLDPDEDLDWD